MRFLPAVAVALAMGTGALSATPADRTETAAPELNAREAFASLSNPGLELLSKSTRLDMADYWEADSVFTARNLMEGTSTLEALTADYAKVRVTPVSTVEIKILPLKKERIVMCVYTVGDSVQARDSQIDFYDSQLRPLDRKKFLSEPDLSDFFTIPKGSATSMKEIREMVPFPTVEYSAEAGSDTLTARLTVEDYVSEDDYNILRLFLNKEVKARWNGKYKF